MLSAIDKSIIRKLQEDIPLTPRPYKSMAEEIGITEEELLSKVEELQNNGALRRIGGILNHREAGFEANAMVVWMISEDNVQKLGEIMASFKEVTHCYERPISGKWPYNIFTMVHGQNKKQCETIIKKISDTIKICDYKILYSTKELKKSSMKYFE
ncbi:Lrp/AsnC family transcriptional regulator [Clostridium scatologenes]|uniref:siroheme decarboxylase n=1 Tax=Clostridium scatologenes TaxID=1548 RepID=A0A0E3M8F2_CLOSL|nr:Lrp/AsnC family transcriptional regulator [Clostridium scatologenes]AKA69750.1 putative transcriptional regulator, AsnC family [Clostridium scatologenes]